MAELSDTDLDDVKQARAMENVDKSTTVLGAEYNDLFVPEDSDFDISSIPDRDANELSDEEMSRLAGMQLDDLFDSTDSISLESLFGEPNHNVQPKTETAAESQSSFHDKNTGMQAGGEQEASAAQILGFGKASQSDAASQEESSADASGAATPDSDRKKPSDSEILNENIPLEETLQETAGKKSKKSKKKAKNKKGEELEDGLPKKSFGQKVKGLFFEIDNTGSDEIREVQNQTADTDAALENARERSRNVLQEEDEELDENERLLKAMYGDDIDGAPLGEEEAPVKLGFFAKLKLLFAKKKAQNQMEEQEEEAAEALENEQRKIRKQEKKEADAVKKEAAKAEKEAKKKEPKPEKPKKEKKPKKKKEPPKPQDVLKIKPKTIIKMVLFVAGLVVLVNLANSTAYYSSSVSRAKLYFQNGNYVDAYEEMAGLSLEDADKPLYDQICVIMFIEKQYQSYHNFVRLNMPVEALDSLIKGIARYQKYAPRAEKLGVTVQFEAARDKVVEVLQSQYGISYEKAVEYANLSESDFVQYYHTIETYGGK